VPAITPNQQHTSGLLIRRCKPLADFTSLLQVNVPVFLLALLVLESKREDRSALLDGVFTLGIAGEGGSNQVESG
jgi:hypothetical protein